MLLTGGIRDYYKGQLLYMIKKESIDRAKINTKGRKNLFYEIIKDISPKCRGRNRQIQETYRIQNLQTLIRNSVTY